MILCVTFQLYRNMVGSNMVGSCGRRQLIIWKDRLYGTRLIEVEIRLEIYCISLSVLTAIFQVNLG